MPKCAALALAYTLCDASLRAARRAGGASRRCCRGKEHESPGGGCLGFAEAIPGAVITDDAEVAAHFDLSGMSAGQRATILKFEV